MADRNTPLPSGEPNPWDRDFVVDARSRRRGNGDVSYHPAPSHRGDASPAAPAGRSPSRRPREVHPFFLLAPWAGIVGLGCSLFAAGAWLLGGRDDLSTAIVVLAAAGLALGGYALAGVFAGRGRPDIAVGAVVLASVALLMWVWMGRPTPVVRPT